jgi:hypothetical protein
MKTVTVNVTEETYRAFQRHASERGTTASELIRSAMEEYYRSNIARAGSILDGEPADAGRVLAPLSPDDDLLGEMLG